MAVVEVVEVVGVFHDLFRVKILFVFNFTY